MLIGVGGADLHTDGAGVTAALTDPETMRLDWGLKLQQKT